MLATVDRSIEREREREREIDRLMSLVCQAIVREEIMDWCQVVCDFIEKGNETYICIYFWKSRYTTFYHNQEISQNSI